MATALRSKLAVMALMASSMVSGLTHRSHKMIGLFKAKVISSIQSFLILFNGALTEKGSGCPPFKDFK
jgi:hypothetical protein